MPIVPLITIFPILTAAESRKGEEFDLRGKAFGFLRGFA